jgi:hypothetical protein
MKSAVEFKVIMVTLYMELVAFFMKIVHWLNFIKEHLRFIISQ